MAIGPTTYSIRNGDTLSSLAKRFNTTVDALAKANNIKNVDLILTGGTLVIPGKRDDYGRFNRPSLGTFTAAAGRKSGRYKDLAAKLRERESAARTSSMESMPVTLESAVSNTGSQPTSGNLINGNDPTLRKLANAKLGTGAEHSCVKTTRDNMVRAGVIKPFSTGNDIGNNPRGAMVQLGQQGWKSVPFPGSSPLTVKSPYGTIQANVLPRDQYLKLMKEGKIPEGAVVFSTRHASWNGTSDGSRGYDMALVRNGGLYNYKQVGPSMYKDLKSVVVMVPASALGSGGGAQKPTTSTTTPTTRQPTPAPVGPLPTGAGAPEVDLLKDAQKLVEDVRSGNVGQLVSDVGQLLRDVAANGTNGLPDGMPTFKPSQLVGTGGGGLVGQRSKPTPQPVTPSTVNTTTSTTKNGFKSVDPAKFREGGTNSLAATVIGTSEGNRTAQGGFTRFFNGHTDPGNNAHNIGSFSAQGGYAKRAGGDPRKADELVLKDLGAKTPAFEAAARKAGLDPHNSLLLSTYYDLVVQSPATADAFLKELPNLAQKGVTVENIVQARVHAFDNNGKGGGWHTAENHHKVAPDALRRTKALVSALKAQGLA